jgi:hypothetical protein
MMDSLAVYIPAPDVDLSVLQEYEQRGLLKSQRCPWTDLTIWNYTPECQRSRQWDAVTLQCRGLVTDSSGTIRARPFSKFFNLGEHEAVTGQSIPDEPFEVYEKLDGSLIIAFMYDGDVQIASRGSFTSPQAERAADLIIHKYNHLNFSTRECITYCFEVLYPENRIVVDYGDREELVLLAMFDTATGNELPLEDVGTPQIRKVEHAGGFRDLPQNPNEEGYVLRFQSGLRVKVKNEEYIRLHRLLTSTSEKSIWEHVRDGRSLSEMLEHVPTEFSAWVEGVVHRLYIEFSGLMDAAEEAFALIDAPSRKEQAEQIQQHRRELWPLLFLLLDGKDPAPMAWKLVKPRNAEPRFRGEA